MEHGAQISVGVLEDNLEFSRFLTGLVDRSPQLRLQFAHETLAGALRAWHAGPVDLLLVDMQLPDGSGLDLVRAAAQSPARILMLTVLADRESVLTALEAGAHGYLLKDTNAERIVAAIIDVLAGDAPISPSAAAHVLATLRRENTDPAARPTPREREIVHMIARGLTYAEVARVLGISVHTVGDHIKAIYRKLEVGSKSEAVFEARNQGWLSRGN